MLKRVLLALTFVAALGAAGVGMAGKAQARHDCDYGYGGYGHGGHYPGYYSSYGYAPRLTYYRSHGYPHYGRHHHRGHRHGHHHRGHHRGHSGVYFSIGF